MILYVDTSTSYLYAALFNDKVIDSISLDLGRDLSSKSLSLINEMIQKNNITFNDLKKIIAVNGPGSFTGVRVGLTIAKMISWSVNIPIITISSLEAMALSSIGDYDYVVPAIDARRSFYFAGIYSCSAKNFVLKEQYINYSVLIASIESLPGKAAIVSNDNFNSNYDLLKYNPDYDMIIKNVMDREATPVHLVDANYLKRTEAEENLDDNGTN